MQQQGDWALLAAPQRLHMQASTVDVDELARLAVRPVLLLGKVEAKHAHA
jgi:hypothetical protein